MPDWKREYTVTFVVLAAIVLFVGIYTWSVHVKQGDIESTDTPVSEAFAVLPGDTPYTDIDGTAVALASPDVAVLVVHSWASWCPVCMTTLHQLAHTHEAYQDQSVKILAINRAEPSATAQAFLAYAGVDTELTLILDPTDRYYQSIGGYTMPETVFYNAEGAIVYHHRGEITAEVIQQYIDTILSTTE